MGLTLSGCYSGTRPPRIGTAAPDFTVKDSDHSVSLSQLKGQVVVLNFWATWCAPCVEEVPSLVQMQQRMKSKGVTVLAVSIDVDEGNYKRFVRDHSVNLLTVRDPDQKSNSLYGTFEISGDIHHRPQWGGAQEVYWSGGLDRAGDHGLSE